MAGSFQSIFRRKNKQVLVPPEKVKPLMRVLEPRILLDAAAIETALDIAGQAAHSQLADDYISNTRSVENTSEADERAVISNAPSLADEELSKEAYLEDAVDTGLAPRRTDGEIVFIDAGVKDPEALIASLEPGVSVHILDAKSDGVQQIADILEESGGFDAVHIFSHGVAGSLQLGNDQLDTSTIDGKHAQALATIGSALSENGDILIYGCDFGQGELGRLAAARLANATGADIAASDDLTGSESLSGDWDLEVHTGTIERQAFSAPDWNSILSGYNLIASVQPIIGHLDDGIVGTNGTTALWGNAVEYDPGGGAPLEYFDIRATLIGLSEDVSATFESVTSGPNINDFRVVITNIGPVVDNVGGQDVLDEGSVSVQWSIFVSGTDTAAPTDKIDIIMRDLDGLAGQAATEDTVILESENITSYTVEGPTDLSISADLEGLFVSGTTQGNNASGSQITVSWESANEFVVTYVSQTLQTNFDMGGNADLASYTTPTTVASQSLDLNGADGAGSNYLAIYANGTTAGSDLDVPLSIADLDVSIFDLDNEKLVGATIHLTNVSAGDLLNYDEPLLNKLGLFVNFTQVPSLPAAASEYTLVLSGDVLISNYLTAIQSITYSNDNPDATFDQVTPRVIDVSITDGIHITQSTTTIIIGTAGDAPTVGNNIYVEDEDVAIIASAANGLLADDKDKNGDDLDVVGVTDSTGVALVDNGSGFWINPVDVGGNSTLANGATLSVNMEDGSFSYTPAPYYSGNETFAYAVSDGTYTKPGFVTFDIQPVVNDVTLNIIAPNPATDPGTDEDQPSQSVSVDGISPDASEQQFFEAINIPFGVILTDGTNSFTADADEYDVDITTWDRTQIRVLPVENSDEEIAILFLVRNVEIDGSWSDDTQTVVYKVNAIADVPGLIVTATGAGIDEDVNLSTVIQPTLFDLDGSEVLTDITLSAIPAGGRFFVNNSEITVTGGVIVISRLDLNTLVFRPPPTGAEAVYNLVVTATATEVTPNGDVTTLSATTAGVILKIDLNDNDNPVVAVDDAAVTFAGETVTIDVLVNDFTPDGSPLITRVDGVLIDLPTPVTLAGGEGVVSLDAFGRLVFDAAPDFAGEVSFTYTVQDVDFSEDTATVTVKVQPRWSLTSSPSAQEGGNASFTLTIDGAVQQGSSISTDVVLQDISSLPNDHATIADAINDSITNYGQSDYSFDGTTLTYTAPDTSYTSSYDAGSNQFIDISSFGEALSLGDDSITTRSFGFNFDFYGSSFSSAYIAANGYLTFGSAAAESDNQPLDGGAMAGRPIIAPFWDDLNTSAGSVYVTTIGIEPGTRQYVVQWDGVTNNSDGAGTGSFQVVLNEANGEIWFNYVDVEFDGTGDGGAGATIGLQSASGIGDEYSFNAPNSVANGSSLIFSRGVTVTPQFVIDVAIVDDAVFEIDESFILKLENPIDSAFGNNTATVTIAVSDNLAPITVDDSISVLETSNQQLNIINPDANVTGESGEDSDPEGQSMSISQLNGVSITQNSVITLASGATVGVNVNGTVNYDPNGAFNYLEIGEVTTDTFTYHVRDVYGEISVVPSTVTVTITGENQAPEIDLNDNGASFDRSNSIAYAPTEVAMNVASPNATIVDPDDTVFGMLNLTLGGFVQPANEIIRVGVISIPYGSAAGTQIVVLGSTTYSVVYDGADALSITKDGGGDLSAADINEFVRAVQYENDSSDDTPGIRTIDFSANDAEDTGIASTVSILVIGNNNPPDAVDDGDVTPYVTAEDTAILVTLLEITANDSDPDAGDTFTVISVDGGLNGSAVLDGNGNVIFTPAQDFVGLTSFNYTIQDIGGATATADVFVDVTPVNDAPLVDANGGTPGRDYAFVYSENDPAASIFSLDGDVIDVDNAMIDGAVAVMTGGQIGDILEVGSLPTGITASVVPVIPANGLTAPGTITITLTGSATPADYTIALRTISFSSTLDAPLETDRIVSVSAMDSALTSVIATTTISVSAVNDAPITVADGPVVLAEDSFIIITTASLLSNDSDAENDTLTVTSVQAPSNGGTVGFNGVGDIVYAPSANYFGPASFTYTVEDGNGGVTTETVNLTVTSVNDVTIIDLDANSAGTGFAIAYIENATPEPIVDPTFSILDVDDVDLVSAQISLANGFVGDVIDVPSLASGVTMSVTPAVPLGADGPVILTLTGVASLAEYESMIRSATFFIASDAPSEAIRNITISVNDGDSNSNVGVTSIAVTAVNDAPIAVDDNSIVFDEDTARTIFPAELLANDSDPDLENFTLVSVQSATNGTAVLNGNGSVTFTPIANFFGAASFTYTIDDGNGEQATATVNLTITSVNDVTVVDLDTATAGNNFAVTYNEDDTVGVALVDTSILLQDIDDTLLDGAAFILTDGQLGDELIVGSLPAGITASIIPAGALLSPQQISVTLTGSASLADYQIAMQAISYRSDSQAPTLISNTRNVDITVSDGDDISSATTTTITVIASNDTPLVGTDVFNVAEDSVLTINPTALLANDVDPDGDTLQVTAVANPVNGTVSLVGGIIVFTPPADYFGAASFEYTIEDGNGGVVTGVVNVTVDPVNDAPLADLNSIVVGTTSYSTAYTEGGVGAIVTDASVLLSDVDDTALDGATVILMNGQPGDILAVGALPAGISASLSPVSALVFPGTFSVTLTGGASFADYQTALQAITYSSESNDPNVVDRTISVSVTDGEASSAAAITTVVVTSVNDAPVGGTDGPFTLDEDSSFAIATSALLFNDTDGENNPLQVTLVGNAINGTVSMTGSVVSFIPDADYSGPASFDYTVSDGNGGTDVVTVDLIVSEVADAPLVDLDGNTTGNGYSTSFTENELPVAVVDPSIAISDIDTLMLNGATIILSNGQVGDILSVSGLPTGISATISPSSALLLAGQITVELSGVADALTYQQALEGVGYSSDSNDPSATDRAIFVTVNDGVLNSATATTIVTVIPANDAPVAGDDGIFTIDEDVTFNIAATALLFNDNDYENDALSVTSVQGATNGTVSFAGGLVTFIPDANYFGPASFTYTVSDTNGGEDIATVSLNVGSVNDAPEFDANTATTGVGHTTSYLENDPGIQLIDASALLVDVDNTDLNSAIFVLSNGRVGDVLEVGSLPAAITASIVPASALVIDGTVTVTLNGLASQADYLTALHAVTFRSVSDNPDFSTRSVSLTISDGSDNSAVATTLIAVNVVNDAPIAGPDGVFSFDEDTVLALPVASLLLNDSDAEGDALTIISVQGAVNGVVVLGADSVVRFTPDAAYHGPASYTYTVRDAQGAETTATVTLEVLFLNDAPIVDLNGSGSGNDFSVTYNENASGVVIADASATIFDEDHVQLQDAQITLTNGQAGDILEIGTLPGGMSVSVVPGTALSGAGAMTVTITGAASQADYTAALLAVSYRSTSENPDITNRIIEISAFDGLDRSQIATTTVAVNSINDAPVATDDGTPIPFVVVEDTPFTFDPVTGNDFDVEGDALTITEIDGIAISSGGTVTLVGGEVVDLAADGVTLTFNPVLNFNGPVSFVYTLSDGNLTDVATVNLDVSAVNDAPDLVDDGPVVLVEDGSVNFDPVTPNDSDVEGDTIDIVSIDGQTIAPLGTVTTTNGTISLAADGRTLTFVASPQFNGQTIISYGASDGQDVSFANITFDVSAVDDPLFLISTPSNLTLNDSDTVNLAMADYVNDPDGDALVFIATGLPLGLAIDSATGVISGVVDSSASQSGPYSIVVTVDDGVTSVISMGFDINVLNVAPVSNGDVVIPLDDGANFTINSAAYFVDGDGDVLSYTALGLPSWASLNGTTGEIIGNVTNDASVFGPVAVTVSADDGEGGTVSVLVTLDPRNLAPIAIATINDQSVQEEDLIDLDVGGLFVDGGSDTDPLVLSVSGLPDGVTFDPLTNHISGEYAAGSGSSTPYVVTIIADDGQGGTVSQSFSIRISHDTYLASGPVFPGEEGGAQTSSVVTDSNDGSSVIIDIVSGFSDLNGTTTLDSKGGVLLSAIDAIDPLYEATGSGSDGGLPGAVNDLGEMASSTDWLHASGREGNGDWDVGGTFGFMSLVDEKALRDANGADERLERISLDVATRQGTLFIEFSNKLNAEFDGIVVKTMLLLPDGSPLPEWMKLVREGFVSAKPPVGEEQITIELIVTLGNGTELHKPIHIDLVGGKVIETLADVEKNTDEKNAKAGGEEKDNTSTKATVGFDKGSLRGSLSDALESA